MSVSWWNSPGDETAPIAIRPPEKKFITPVPELEPLERDWFDLFSVKVILTSFAVASVVASLAVVVFSIWFIFQVVLPK